MSGFHFHGLWQIRNRKEKQYIKWLIWSAYASMAGGGEGRGLSSSSCYIDSWKTFVSTYSVRHWLRHANAIQSIFSKCDIFKPAPLSHTHTHFVICLMSVNVMTGLTDKPCWSARKMVSKNEKWPETFFFVVRRPPLSTWWNASLRHLRMWDGKFSGVECTNARFLTLRCHRSHFFSSIVFRHCVQ